MQFDFASTDVCVYHNNCHDGFCCAYFVWSRIDRFGEKGIEYVAKNPSTQLNDDDLEQFRLKNVLVVDLSFDRENLLKIKEVAKSLIVVDHHKTAMETLKDLDFAVFDMNYSGAGLLYKLYVEYLNRFTPGHVPFRGLTNLIRYVQDRDIWKWELPNSKEINAYLQTIPFDFDTWYHVEHLLDNDPENIISSGAAILATQNRMTKEIASNASLVDLYVSPDKLSTVKARVVNCPVRELISMVGHEIVEEELAKPESERAYVAVMYTIFPDGNVLFSLRSSRDFDASVIAKSWGGGGHKSACGFKGEMINGFPWVLVDEPFKVVS